MTMKIVMKIMTTMIMMTMMMMCNDFLLFWCFVSFIVEDMILAQKSKSPVI